MTIDKSAKSEGGKNRVLLVPVVPPRAAGQPTAKFSETRLQLGYLPALSVASAIGLLTVSVAYAGGRQETPWAELPYWLGLLIVFVPICLRLLSPAPSRQERIGLVVLLGLALYLTKVMYSPLELKFVDELQHWRTADDLLGTGQLFVFNPALPVSPLYPGLEIATGAISSLTGLTIFYSGIILIAISRLLLSLALFLFYEKAGGSAYIAGVASAIYASNPHFQFLNAVFTYQSLALSLLSFVLFLVVMRESKEAVSKTGLIIALIAGLAAVTTTHHVSSYALIGFLVIWSAVAYFIRRRQPMRQTPLAAALMSLAFLSSWIIWVAPETVSYIAEPLSGAATDIVSLISGQPSHGKFSPPPGPMHERLLSLMAIGLIIAGLSSSLWYLVRRRHTLGAAAWMLAFTSLSYFGTLVIRLSSQGAELAGRSWPFVFLPVGFVLAALFTRLWSVQNEKRSRVVVRAAIVLCLTLIFVGGITGGWPPFWGRLPGKYLVQAHERSIEPEGVSAALWARRELEPNNRIAADATNDMLMASYGRQDLVRSTSSLFVSPSIGPGEISIIRQQQLKYIIVDTRLSTSTPVTGFYFRPKTGNLWESSLPMELAGLEKFDNMPSVSRVFDSGNIRVYYIGPLAHGR